MDEVKKIIIEPRPKASANNDKGSKGMAAKLDDSLTRVVRATKKTVKAVKEDVKATRERDPAAKSDLEVLLLYPGVHALLAHRLAHSLYKKKKFFAARAISQTARLITGIEIHPGAQIGKGLMIDHGMGVVIGETAVIGDNCTLYQGVTLGGTGKDVGKRHPTLGNNVMVGAGAKVLGPFSIGDNTKIAANAVVLTEMPNDCTAVGMPAKVVRREGVKVDALDQVHIPDPVAQQMNKLEARIAELEEQLEAVRKNSK
jgi:serine O-acetyltransferase